MTTYRLSALDLETGVDTLGSILRHLSLNGITLISAKYDAGTWEVVMDKDLPDSERAHFEREDVQISFVKTR